MHLFQVMQKPFTYPWLASLPSQTKDPPMKHHSPQSGPVRSLNRSSTLINREALPGQGHPQDWWDPIFARTHLSPRLPARRPAAPGCSVASPDPWTRASLRGPQEGAGPAPESPLRIPLARGKPCFFCSSQKAPGNRGAQGPLEPRLEEPRETETYP